MVYRTSAAVNAAIACCAPDYAATLRHFVDRSGVPRSSSSQGIRQRHGPPPGFGDRSFETSSGSLDVGGAFVVILLIGVVAIGIALVRGFSGSGTRSTPPPSVDELRGPLAEEIEQVRQEISAVDTATGAPDPGGTAHLASARGSPWTRRTPARCP
jgi:hypothetical protein